MFGRKDPLIPSPLEGRRGEGPPQGEDGQATARPRVRLLRPVHPHSTETGLILARAGLESIARAARAEGNEHFAWMAEKTLEEIDKEVSYA